MACCISWLANFINSKSRSFTKRINEFLSDDSTIKNFGKQKIVSIDEIEFKNVFFKYEKSKDYALKDISFKIKKVKLLGFLAKLVQANQQF